MLIRTNMYFIRCLCYVFSDSCDPGCWFSSRSIIKILTTKSYMYVDVSLGLLLPTQLTFMVLFELQYLIMLDFNIRIIYRCTNCLHVDINVKIKSLDTYSHKHVKSGCDNYYSDIGLLFIALF